MPNEREVYCGTVGRSVGISFEAAQSLCAIHMRSLLNCVVASCEHDEARIVTGETVERNRERMKCRRGRNLFSTFN